MAKLMPPFRSAGAATARPAALSDDDHVGAELRDARLRMGVDVEAAARDLKIRVDYLIGLEQNDHAALPGLPYALGFVRSYAAYVGLDPVKLARRFREESGRSPVDHDYTWLKPIEQGRFSRSFFLLLSLAIAGGAYTGWYYRTADVRKPAAAVDIAGIEFSSPGPVASADNAAGTAGPDRRPETGLSPPAKPGPNVREDAAKERDSAAVTAPTESPPESRLPGATLGRADADRDRIRNAETEIAGARPTVILKALGLVWIRVRDPRTRRVIVEGIMKQGNEVTVPDEPGLVLDVGRASQIEFLIDGESAGLAGPTAAVRHNISLDPAKLARPGAAAAARDPPASRPDGDRGGAENAEGGTSEAPPAAADGAIVLKARGPVWIRVRHPQTRQVIVEGIMKKGNAFTVPKEPGLVLDVGRANQIEYLMDGEAVGLAGDSPGPVHNLSLDPALMRPGG